MNIEYDIRWRIKKKHEKYNIERIRKISNTQLTNSFDSSNYYYYFVVFRENFHIKWQCIPLFTLSWINASQNGNIREFFLQRKSMNYQTDSEDEDYTCISIRQSNSRQCYTCFFSNHISIGLVKVHHFESPQQRLPSVSAIYWTNRMWRPLFCDRENVWRVHFHFVKCQTPAIPFEGVVFFSLADRRTRIVSNYFCLISRTIPN